MSNKIDERVVEMRFDNAQFEKNVSTTMSTLDKLKKSLNLDGAAKGLENVNAAAKSFDMSPLANGVDTIRARFSALEVMAVTALANITNSAVNAGKNLVKAFTIDPIKTGFQEYETQINAVQTILSNTRSKGTTLDQVNAALDELNHYADMTIYNFTEMTRNIGTFTAAGIDLETSVSAIKGIANLAAVSGSNAQQASTAMYQLSQALASGRVNLMDWNSVVNAGMGGQVFQDALKETARVHGIAIDDMIKKEGSFRETLKNGWLTSEILTETLSKFTGDLTEEQLKSMGYTEEQAKSIMALGEDANNAATKVKTFTQLLDTLKEAAQSGWTQTWEYIVGDFEEARKLWTSVSDTLSEMIGKSADARNKVVGEWAENGGRAAAVEALKNAFEGLMNIIRPIKNAFREVFPPATSEQLIKITEKIRDLSKVFKEWTDKYGDKIKSTFEGIFSIIKIGVTVVKSIVGGIVQLIGKIAGLSGGIISVTGSLGGWISGIAKSITETNLFGKVVDGVVGFLGKAIDKIKEFGSYIKGKFEAPGFETFLNILNTIWTSIKKVGLAIVNVMSTIGNALGNAFRNGDMKSLLDLVNGGIVTAILLKLKSWISGFKDLAGKGKSFVSAIKEVLNIVGDSLTAWQQNLKVNTIKSIAISIGILAAALWVLSGIDPDKLGSALGAITVLFAELIGVMKAFDKLAINIKGTGKITVLMIGMAAAVLILASAAKKLSELDLEGLAKGVAGVGVLLAELVGAAKLMSIGGKNISKGAMRMVLMAAALKIMASVCKDLSALSWKEIAKGVSGIGGLLAVFAGFAELIKLIKPEKLMRSALSLIFIGVAMEIFANVCAKFGEMKWGSLGKAGAAISGILLIAAGFGKLSGYASKMVRSSAALVIIGAAMEIFADVCNKFGQTKWEELAKAGTAIGGILVFASGFALLAGLSSKMFSSVICLTIMAAAMEIFTDVCNKFGQMKWEELAKAGVAIGGLLALAAGFALLAGLAPGMFASSAALLVMAAALTILTPVLTTLGNISWSEIGKGLLVIAGAFTIFGLAGLLLGPVVPVILALSAAITLFGIGCLAVGAGVLAFSAGLTALAASAAAGATALVAALHIIVVGIIELIPATAGALTDAIVSLCQVFIQSMPAISKAIKVFILNISKVLVKSIPVIADSAARILVGVLKALTKNVPQLVDGLVNLLIAVLSSLAQRLPELTESLTNFLVQLFSSIGDNIRPIMDVLAELFGTIFKTLIDSLGGIIKSVLAPILDIIADLFVGIVEAIAPYIPVISDAITEIVPVISDAITKIVQAIAPFIPDMRMMVETISECIQKIVDAIVAIVQQIAPVIDTITKLVKQVGDTIVDVFGKAEEIITKVGDALDKVLQGVSDVLNGVADVIDEVGDTIEESLGGLSDTVDSILGGVAEVIDSFAGVIDEVLSPLNNLINGIFGGSDVEVDPAAVKKSIEYIAESEDELGSVSNILFDLAQSIETIGNYSGNLHLVAEDMKDLSKKVKPTLDRFTGLAAAVASASSDMLSIVGSAERSRDAFDSMATSFRVAMKSIESAYSAYGESTMGKMVEGIQSGASKIKISMLLILIETVTIAASTTDKFLNVGKSLSASLANGIKSGLSEAKTTFASALSESVSDIRSYYGAYYDAGSYLVDGLADGINKNSFKVKTAASEMAKAAKEEIKKILKINSPSKVFRDIGYSVPEGFAMGIDRMSRLVAGSAKNMAGSALDSTKKALSNVVRMMNSDISSQPTIRPVLDLSDVSAGAGAINGMFNMTPSVGVMSNIGTISSMMNRVQNGANDDVISAIKDLGRTIGNASGDTYQINGITYDDGTEVSDAIGAIVRAARIERRR